MKRMCFTRAFLSIQLLSVFTCGNSNISHELANFTDSFPCSETWVCSSANESESNYTMGDRPTTTPYYPDFTLPDFFSELTPEDIEMYLERPDTQEYLNRFPHSLQRLIVQETLRYCPYTKLCNFSFGLEPSPFVLQFKAKCCSDCECNSGCEIHGNCCPDYTTMYFPTSEDATTEEILQTCMITEIRYQPANGGVQSDILRLSDSVLTYQACPVNVDQDLRFRCEGEFRLFPNLTSDDVIPLTENGTTKTYRNKHCAVCNGADLERLIPWSVRLSCNAPPVFTSVGQLVLTILDGRADCELNLNVPISAEVVYCDNVISDCNTTGLWNSFDPDIYRACNAYQAIVDVEKDLVTYTFRNPFCAICNGMTPSNYYCDTMSYDAGRPFSFSGLLRTDTLEDTKVSRDTSCGSDSMFDDITMQCRKVICAFHRTFKDGQCEQLFDLLGDRGYRVSSLIKPSTEIPLQDMYEIMPNLTSIIQDGFISFTNGYMCTRRVKMVSHNVLRESDVIETIDQIDLMLDMVSDQNLEEFVDNTLKLDESNFTFATKSNQTFTFKLFIKDDVINHSAYIPYSLYENWTIPDNTPVDLDELLNFSYVDNEDIAIPYFTWNENYDTCSFQGTFHRLLTLRPCPMFSINTLDFRLVETTYGFKLKEKEVLGLSDYVKDESDAGVIRICVETYESVFREFFGQDGMDGYTAETIVSIVSVSISVTCLIVTLFTYCFFTQLRTLPGKNNMALITSLLAAQSLYLFSSFGGLDTNTFSCKLVGGLTHFFWLLSVFWMNACTFHMFRVLLKTRDLSRSANTKKHVQYHVYTLALSSVFVIGNIIVSMLKSNNSDIGYGGSRCYISTQRMVEVTFGIPAAIVVTANISMFTTIVIKLKRAPTVSKNVKYERRYFIVFAKLSSITGATWLFGFAYMWTGITALSFLFIVLNGSQGLFIMLSFTCNARTLSMYTERSKSLRTSQDSQRNSTKVVTDSSFKSKD